MLQKNGNIAQLVEHCLCLQNKVLILEEDNRGRGKCGEWKGGSEAGGARLARAGARVLR